MFRKMAAMLVALTLAPCAASVSADMIEMSVEIQNETGVDIHELYATSSAQQNWGGDILGDFYLDDGSDIIATFDVDEAAPKWDMMMVDAQGNNIELNGLDFSECTEDGGMIVLSYDEAEGGTATLYAH